MRDYEFEYELPDEKDIWFEAVMHAENFESALYRLRDLYPDAVIRYRKTTVTYYKPLVNADV